MHRRERIKICRRNVSFERVKDVFVGPLGTMISPRKRMTCSQWRGCESIYKGSSVRSYPKVFNQPVQRNEQTNETISVMNALIYVRSINNHHKYFGRHISWSLCQHGPRIYRTFVLDYNRVRSTLDLTKSCSWVRDSVKPFKYTRWSQLKK